MYTLLIVEDNEHQRALYRNELEQAGYMVLAAASGEEALETVGTVHIDLVILDVSMPGMDGIETLGRLLAGDRKMPVILHTAYSNYKTNFMSWSAERYVVKSSDLSELKNAIVETLAERGRAEEPKQTTPRSGEVGEVGV